MKLLLQSLAERGRYDEADFTRRLDEELLAGMDGRLTAARAATPTSPFARFTTPGSARAELGQTGGYADTSEAAERIASWRRAMLRSLSAALWRFRTPLSQIDPNIVSPEPSPSAAWWRPSSGRTHLDEALAGKLREMVKHADLPFRHAVLAKNAAKPQASPRRPRLPCPFRTRCPAVMLRAAARDRASASSRPAGAIVYGLPCAINFLLPAAYYLAARFAAI